MPMAISRSIDMSITSRSSESRPVKISLIFGIGSYNIGIDEWKALILLKKWRKIQKSAKKMSIISAKRVQFWAKTADLG